MYPAPRTRRRRGIINSTTPWSFFIALGAAVVCASVAILLVPGLFVEGQGHPGAVAGLGIAAIGSALLARRLRS